MSHDNDEVRGRRFGSKVETWQLSQCLTCAHWEGNRTCSAFDGHIPLSILENSFDHREEHPKDNGKTWTPDSDDVEHPMD